MNIIQDLETQYSEIFIPLDGTYDWRRIKGRKAPSVLTQYHQAAQSLDAEYSQ
jgi:hypothetical protein